MPILPYSEFLFLLNSAPWMSVGLAGQNTVKVPWNGVSLSAFESDFIPFYTTGPDQNYIKTKISTLRCKVIIMNVALFLWGIVIQIKGFPLVQRVKNLPAMWDTRVWFLGWEDSLEKGMASPVFLPGEFHWQRSIGGLQSIGLKRVGHDIETKTFTFTLSMQIK